jgi:hypothetical protein
LLATPDFQEALAALLGKDAPNLSPAVISRLTAEWQEKSVPNRRNILFICNSSSRLQRST